MRSPGPFVPFAALILTALAACGARSSLLGASAEATPHKEECNGVDDDLNGEVDDVPPISCGVGACRLERPGCADGKPATCQPGARSPEVCNGIDDDCDGAVDEELGFGPVAGPFVLAKDYWWGIASTSLIATPTGLLAVWATWFDGDAPEPNTFARALGPDAQPTADAVPILERAVNDSLRAAPSQDDAIVLTYCGLYGTEGRATSARIDGTGKLLGGETARSPGQRSCSSSSKPDGVWTGSQHLFAWLTQAEAASNDLDIVLDVAGEGGDSMKWRSVFSGVDVSIPARIAVAPGRAAVTAGRRASDGAVSLLVSVLDAAGEPITATIDLGPPVDGGAWQSPTAAPAGAGGFLLLGENGFGKNGLGSGLVRARISSDGAILEPPTVIEGTDWKSDNLVVAARGAAGFVATGFTSDRSYVLALSDDGHVTGSWVGDPSVESFFFASSIAVRDGRVFVLYQAGTQPELRIREFGCMK